MICFNEALAHSCGPPTSDCKIAFFLRASRQPITGSVRYLHDELHAYYLTDAGIEMLYETTQHLEILGSTECISKMYKVKCISSNLTTDSFKNVLAYRVNFRFREIVSDPDKEVLTWTGRKERVQLPASTGLPLLSVTS